MRAFKYSLDEALLSVWRGRRSGILSMATIAAAVFVLGAFLLITQNLERLLARWSQAAEFAVYLRDDISEEQRVVIERVLAGSGLVERHEFVSKAEALRRFQRDFADLADVADGLPENPLPASFEVRLRQSATDRDALSRLAGQLSHTAGTADVRYDQRWMDRVTQAVSLIRAGGVALASILVLAASLTVANVVRLALYTRHDEIHIMQLVGAPMTYIRGPFVVEGILQGGLGALAAVALLWGTFAVGLTRYGAVVAQVIDSSLIAFLPPTICGLLLAGGMAVGCIGGLVAARSAR